MPNAQEETVSMSFIYLDSAATAKYTNIDDIIVKTMSTAMQDSWMNPSSLYAVNAREKINKCRANVAEFIGAKPEEIIFTSGASESNNLAIRGWADKNINFAYFLNIVTTPIEHKSILNALQNKALTPAVHYCDVDKYGRVDCKSLEKILSEHEHGSCLVSIGLANNEIGTTQDIMKIADIVHKHDGILHTDATQAFGHMPIDVNKFGIDMMSCSGHKISPVLRGVGFLYKRNDISISPLIYGTQENGLRGGTENTYGILGLNKALEYCDVDREDYLLLSDKRDYFISCLNDKFGCVLNGHWISRLPNNINVTFPQNITGESLLCVLDMSNIKIGVGSACNSRSIEPSHVLKAIGLTDEEAMRTVRLTLPDDITYREIDKVIDEIEKALKIIEIN